MCTTKLCVNLSFVSFKLNFDNITYVRQIIIMQCDSLKKVIKKTLLSCIFYLLEFRLKVDFY